MVVKGVWKSKGEKKHSFCCSQKLGIPFSIELEPTFSWGLLGQIYQQSKAKSNAIKLGKI